MNPISSQCRQFLGLVSAPRPTEARGRRLHTLARYVCWSQLTALANAQRIAPLLYWHLREHDIHYPSEVRRTLGATLIRERAIAAAQTATLTEIIAALRAASIPSVVLKGGALAHLLYPEPGLRPKEDLDILVPPDAGEAARAVLCELGFHAPPPSSRYDRLQHHLPIAHRQTGDILVYVEIHVAAFNLLMDHELTFQNLERPLVDYSAGGEQMQTLAPTQMLWMQYHGLRKLAEPVRYLHLADLVGLADQAVDRLDWVRLKRDHPDLWHALGALHAFSPLAEEVCGRLGLDPERPPAPRRIGEDYQGWPRRSFSEIRGAGARLRLLRDTLLPPEWWARFTYGVPCTRGLAGVLLYRHPAAFVNQGLRRLYLGPVRRGAFFKQPV